MSTTQNTTDESTDEESSGDNEGVIAPSVTVEPRVHRTNSLLQSGPTRTDIGGFDSIREDLWMDQYDGKRNLFEALGYVNDPRYEHYRARYERTDTAKALVDKLPMKAWDVPRIVDPKSEGEESEFEKAVNAFLAGEYTEDDPIEVMERAARMERLGNFSLIFIGFNDDGANPTEADQLPDIEDEEFDPAMLLKNEVDKESLEDVPPDEAIEYIKPYDQGRVDVDMINWVDDDPTHPRFMKPESYQVDLGDHRPTTTIHWSRVIHVVGNVFDNDIQSPSALKPSLNRIDDIEKILGGSAEGYWRAAYTGLVISPPEINGRQSEFSDDGETLHNQIDRYINNLSREIFTAADIETIDVTVEDPTGHLESQYKDIATGHDIPQSILMGNETGERATQEDREMWHERVGEFRTEYCEPAELRPIIDRLIDLNVFPQPEGGKYAYRIIWPSLDEQSEQEQWNVRQTKSNAIATGTGGNPLLAMSIEEYRQEILGWKPQRGSMVESDEEMEAATAAELETRADLQVDEEDDRVQEQFQTMTGIDADEFETELHFRLNNLSLESIEEILDKENPDDDEVRRLKVNSPDGRGIIVDVLREGFDVEEASVEASEENPKVVVVTENEDKPFGFYTLEELEAEDWDSGIEDPTADLGDEEDRQNALIRGVESALGMIGQDVRIQQEGHFTWPKSWREAEKPARLIALDAWISMGARHGGGGPGGCTSTMRGQVADPDRFCADFKDRIYQWDYWRGDSWAPGD